MYKFKYLNHEFFYEQTNFCHFAATDFYISCNSTQNDLQFIQGLVNVVIEQPLDNSSFLQLNINFKDSLDKTIKRQCDSEILLCRSIDRILRTLLRNVNKKITINLQITCYKSGNKELWALISSLIAIKHLFSINVGIYYDNNTIIAANKQEIIAIEWIAPKISFNNTYDYLSECVEKCISLIGHLKHIKSKYNIEQVITPEIEYNTKENQDFYSFQKQHNLCNEQLIFCVNKYLFFCEKRLDGRNWEDIREISYRTLEDNVIFSRGDTVVLSNIFHLKESQDSKNNLFSTYNFPPFSTGESNVRQNNRREIGHGNLIKNAFQNVINKSFILKLNAHVLSANGSSSMAGICAHSINLQQKGIISEAIYGISVGGVKFNDQLKLFVDMTADEDAISFMDFKISGTPNYVTAIQMDSKSGLPLKELKNILDFSQKALTNVFSKITVDIPKDNLITIYEIPKSKLGAFIGVNGDHIKLLGKYTNCTMKNTQNGSIFVKGENQKLLQYAIRLFAGKFKVEDHLSFILKEDSTVDENGNVILYSLNGKWIYKNKLEAKKNDFIVCKIIEDNVIEIDSEKSIFNKKSSDKLEIIEETIVENIEDTMENIIDSSEILL